MHVYVLHLYFIKKIKHKKSGENVAYLNKNKCITHII